MGGFIPTCQAQTFVELAKLENVMAFYDQVPEQRQTPWGCGHKGAIWYACVHPDIDDEIVIENAKRIVDKALPQRLSTFFGGHYYSFITREYLLNLLLFYYADHARFPVGPVCVISNSEWDGMFRSRKNRWINWMVWKYRVRPENSADANWYYIPSL